ncbi:YqhR family membrane protein [Anaerobacillus sp. MEB173]|uniref:YqhR family membrane protein n=1 Tax=Anaerobacillus sp. MEB173 TaxID=3383345 RepID=UPI003F916A5F
MENEKKLEQNKTDEPMSFNARIASIGFFGGLFWSLMGYVAFFFNFMTIGPALVLMPWALGEWKHTYIGHLVGILVIGLLSILVAFIYRMLLAKVFSIWSGAFYGFVLWLVVFYLLNPIFPGLKSVPQLGTNTIITGVCLFVLYGVFIGYSISYDYKEMNENT